jgi:hypothetical protein
MEMFMYAMIPDMIYDGISTADAVQWNEDSPGRLFLQTRRPYWRIEMEYRLELWPSTNVSSDSQRFLKASIPCV